MDENVPIEAKAEVTAPEQEATAVPASVETDTPETPAEQEAAKTFTQEELDAIVGKRLAREQRKWEREQQQRQEEAKRQQAQAPAKLTPEDFASYDEYADALAERKAEELLAKREAARQQAEILDAYHDREEQVREKYDDFQQVAYNPDLPISEAMAQCIQASEIGPEVLYYLGTKPSEAARISRMSALLQAQELGKIEAALVSSPPVRKTSTAPAPIAPVTARSTGTPRHDTTDPRSTKSMSTAEWIEAERARQIKRYEAQFNR